MTSPGQSRLVSVLIPAFNGRSTIGMTLASVANQKYRPLQVIVIDDASRDDTSEIIVSHHFGSDISDFTVVRHEKNLGLARSLNDGLRRARGEFVLILHQDCELVGEDWIAKALLLMSDEEIGVVTGYYGLTDTANESFVKTSFAILRRQYHSKPSESVEDVTFSEGKCDLYRRGLLAKINDFPESFRIAGEDLVASYSLRQLGYRIVKSYELPVIQRFTGKAESFRGNVGKEFLFGKAMGGVFGRFRLYLFSGVKNLNYSGQRSVQRASQPLFVLAFVVLALLSLLIDGFFPSLAGGLVLLRVLFYFFTVLGELRMMRDSSLRLVPEAFATSLIGLLSDFAYTLGFAFGLIRYAIGLEL